jgi:RNA polymerase-interacting CarD/CdnL/TRCF family regulator
MKRPRGLIHDVKWTNVLSGHEKLKGGLVMNKSEVLRALEWVDQAAQDGDGLRLAKAKQALDDELASKKNLAGHEAAYTVALESFVRKHGREPMEEIVTVE